jgi:ABC-type transport system involved in Fe-S cluster assembly fused permease/ATPase subunit
VARRADLVLVLDGGVVVDAGDYEHVARPGSPYQRLWLVDDEEVTVST